MEFKPYIPTLNDAVDDKLLHAGMFKAEGHNPIFQGNLCLPGISYNYVCLEAESSGELIITGQKVESRGCEVVDITGIGSNVIKGLVVVLPIDGKDKKGFEDLSVSELEMLIQTSRPVIFDVNNTAVDIFQPDRNLDLDSLALEIQNAELIKDLPRL